MTNQQATIADQAELEEFQKLPPGQRQLTERLKGVLAETAVTGIIRYPWPLMRPVLAELMEQQLTKYEQEEHVEIGPARPMLGSCDDSVDSVAALCQRFNSLMAAFDSAPWTLQRLCEVLLEPHKQYKRLHKLALAIEKLLLVTSEVGLSQQPGAPLGLELLSRVNEPPPQQQQQGSTAGTAASRQADADGSGLVAAALGVRQIPPQPTGGSIASQAAAQAQASTVVGPAAAAAAAAAAGSTGAADDGPLPAPMETEAPEQQQQQVEATAPVPAPTPTGAGDQPAGGSAAVGVVDAELTEATAAPAAAETAAAPAAAGAATDQAAAGSSDAAAAGKGPSSPALAGEGASTG